MKAVNGVSKGGAEQVVPRWQSKNAGLACALFYSSNFMLYENKWLKALVKPQPLPFLL